MLYPVYFGIRLSFFSLRLGKPLESAAFIGFDNYLSLLKDPFFITSLKVTLIFTIAVVISETVLGMILALLLEERIVGLRVWRTIFILPVMIAPVDVPASRPKIS